MPIIKQDGKNYNFTPGKNGSLVDMNKQKPAAPITSNPHISKIVPCTNCGEPVAAGSSSCSACGGIQKPQPEVGSSRG